MYSILFHSQVFVFDSCIVTLFCNTVYAGYGCCCMLQTHARILASTAPQQERVYQLPMSVTLTRTALMIALMRLTAVRYVY